MDAMRLDKWLWAARFFKTRSLAARELNAGHVSVAGMKAKASRMVQIGDMLSIRVGLSQYLVQVLALSAQRGPAASARLLYEESPESINQREAEAAQRALTKAGLSQPRQRPDKHERRKIRQFLKKE